MPQPSRTGVHLIPEIRLPRQIRVAIVKHETPSPPLPSSQSGWQQPGGRKPLLENWAPDRKDERTKDKSQTTRQARRTKEKRPQTTQKEKNTTNGVAQQGQEGEGSGKQWRSTRQHPVGLGTTLLHVPPRQADERWHPGRQPGRLSPGRSAFEDSTSAKTPASEGVRREVRKAGGDREVPEDRRGTQMPAVQHQGSRRPGFSSSGETEVNSAIADRIARKNFVASTTAAQSVVPPAVEDLAAKPASRVAIPNRQAKTTLQSYPKEWRRKRRVPGSRSGREPGSGTGDPAGLEVEMAGPSEDRVLEESEKGLSLDLARQGLLGGGIGLGSEWTLVPEGMAALRAPSAAAR